MKRIDWTSRLHSDHQWMTKAAVEALSAQERNYLGDEAEALFTIYCEFPDQNWSCYGAWGGWSGSPNEPGCQTRTSGAKDTHFQRAAVVV